MNDQKAILKERLIASCVVPVLTIDDASRAADLALALQAGGLKVVEVTLRTRSALEGLRAMKSAAPELSVGAGTILSADDVKASLDAGADFLVTPGTSPVLAEALLDCPVPTFPGAASPSESLFLYELGFDWQKFFPAEPCGGPDYLKAIAGPLPQISFMPTGGISASRARDYLKLKNVLAVGGSWIASGADIESGNWDAIAAYARLAVKCRS